MNKIKGIEIYSQHVNNEGDVFTVLRIESSRKIHIMFIDTKYKTIVDAGNIRKGSVRDRFKRSLCGVGYLGDGEFKISEDNKHTKAYQSWSHMIRRCYSEKFHIKNPSYKDCTVCNEWHNFQVFAKWFYDNYIEGFELDKDIKIKGNREYSPEACMFVSKAENRTECALRTKVKEYELISPDGELVKVKNMSEFCRKKNLNRGNLLRLYTSDRRKHHKGWSVVK